jgi:hypothetical protein
MTIEYDEFQAAYRAWKDATEQYEARISEIWQGTATNDAKMAALVDDMRKKHATFMQSSKPFVR